MDNLEIDYKKAAEQLRSGEALFDKDGALAPLLERILNSALVTKSELLIVEHILNHETRKQQQQLHLLSSPKSHILYSLDGMLTVIQYS